jgi:tRNA threonylcarbamoyladenosine biosynthesis protein TsaE
MTVRRFVSNSSRETIAIGGEIAHLLSSPMLLFLRGDLGAGKTTLVKGIAQALDAADPDEVTSPTFTLVHEYDGKRKVGGKEHDTKLYHIDLYRIPDERGGSHPANREWLGRTGGGQPIRERLAA